MIRVRSALKFEWIGGDAEIASEKIKQKRGRDKQIGVGEREIRQIGQRIRAEEDWAEKRALCSAICL